MYDTQHGQLATKLSENVVMDSQNSQGIFSCAVTGLGVWRFTMFRRSYDDQIYLCTMRRRDAFRLIELILSDAAAFFVSFTSA